MEGKKRKKGRKEEKKKKREKERKKSSQEVLRNCSPGVEQNNPTLTPGVANLEFSVATAMSQLATNWHPAAVAKPSTFAITGIGTS